MQIEKFSTVQQLVLDYDPKSCEIIEIVRLLGQKMNLQDAILLLSFLPSSLYEAGDTSAIHSSQSPH